MDEEHEEIAALKACRSPFIVQMHDYLRQNDLHILLEVCRGGDLRKLYGVETGNGLLPYGSQVHTTFYVACAAVAVDHLHRRWFIHRDVKPENLLMDGRGYVKLTDTGFAKQVTEDPRQDQNAGCLCLPVEAFQTRHP